MRLAPEVSIEPLAAAAHEPPRSRVLLHGRAREAVVTGRLLEGAVRSDDHYLLFLTDDTPYEELLHLHLLDAQGRALDGASIGGPYSSGRFEGPRVLGERRVGFGFIDEQEWEVELLPTWRLRLPLWAEPKGVWRARPLRYHFVLHARPRVATPS